jgi:hypothetical protein
MADDKKVRMATILFADIVGSTEVANERSVVKYGEVIDEYHKCALAAKRIVFKNKEDSQQLYLRGDEACLVCHSGPLLHNVLQADDNVSDYALDILNTLKFAIALRLNWMDTDYNIERTSNQILPREVAIGIHFGPVAFWEHPGNSIPTAEGYSITLAKRIEGYSRIGKYSNIFVSGPVNVNLQQKFDISRINNAELKGYGSTKLTLYEYKSVFDILNIYDQSEWWSLLGNERNRSEVGSWRRIRDLSVSHHDNQWLSLYTGLTLASFINRQPDEKAGVMASSCSDLITVAPEWWYSYHLSGTNGMKRYNQDPSRGRYHVSFAIEDFKASRSLNKSTFVASALIYALAERGTKKDIEEITTVADEYFPFQSDDLVDASDAVLWQRSDTARDMVKECIDSLPTKFLP